MVTNKMYRVPDSRGQGRKNKQVSVWYGHKYFGKIKKTSVLGGEAF